MMSKMSNHFQLIETDMLVIGGGGAALRASIEGARNGIEVLLVDKGRIAQSGTSPLSLHGFAVALDEASEKILFEDIVRTGSNISDLDLVRTMVSEGMGEVLNLEKMGVHFALDARGGYFCRDTGNSMRITFDAAASGMNFVSVLANEAKKCGVQFLEEVMITELLIEHGRFFGALSIDQDSNSYIISAKAAVLAAGGANRLYPNPTERIANEMYRTTGDGYALALKAGLPLVDMEFPNFRDSPPAVRMNGRYINSLGEAFMERYAPEWKERAPRGIIVKAIYRELQAGRGPVTIDFKNRHEKIPDFLPAEYKEYKKAYHRGTPPQVLITFQRLLGGVRIYPDASCDVEGIYLAGENAGGIHGADRLQGGAFLETQVFGRLSGAGASEFARANDRLASAHALEKYIRPGVPDVSKGTLKKIAELKLQLQETAWEYAGVIRNAPGLIKGIATVEKIRMAMDGEELKSGGFELYELRNLALTAEAVMKSALEREETRGTHIRDDFPEPSEHLSAKHVLIHLGDQGELRTEIIPSRGNEFNREITL